MAREKVESERLFRPDVETPLSPESRIKQVDEVIIQVTQAFCPKGHNLVLPDKPLFDGQPGISIHVSDGQNEGDVVLSPYHGDHVRRGFSGPRDGTKVSLSCPICRTRLPYLSRCICEQKGSLHFLYLTPRLDEGHVVALCNVWGCYRSKVFDQAQLLSAYFEESDADIDEALLKAVTLPLN